MAIDAIASWHRRADSDGMACLRAFYVFLSLLAGCASVTIKDELPPNGPKGFVEFYRMRGEGVASLPGVYDLDQKPMVFEGYPPGWHLSARSALRLSRRPGTYRFLVRLGTGAEVVHVAIARNMITPVKVGVSNVQTRYCSPRYPDAISALLAKSNRTITLCSETTFALNVVVEEPIPLE